MYNKTCIINRHRLMAPIFEISSCAPSALWSVLLRR